ncbi:hypothetical protein QFZ98_008297 [Paraburkholderia youngii]
MVGPLELAGRKISEWAPLRSMMIERARTSESLVPCISVLPSDTACGGSPPTLTIAAAPSLNARMPNRWMS